MFGVRAGNQIQVSKKCNIMHKFRMITLCLVFIANLALSGLVLGNVYYCDPKNGNNSNAGTSEAPWADIASVLQTKYHNPITNGDVIKCRNGYHGNLGNYQFQNRRNTDYITIEADDGHTPAIGSARFTDSSYWKLKGFTISRELAPGDYSPSIFVRVQYGSSDHIIIEDCNMYSKDDVSGWTEDDWRANTPSNGVMLASAASYCVVHNCRIRNVEFGVTLGGSNNVVEYCSIENFWQDGCGMGGNNLTFQYNTIKESYDIGDEHRDSIQISKGRNLVIRGNKIIARENLSRSFAGSLQGINCFIHNDVDYNYNVTVVNNLIVVAGSSWGICLDNTIDSVIVGNTIARVATSGSSQVYPVISVMSGAGESRNVTIRNNIAYGFSGNYVDHNLDLDDYGPYAVFVDYEHNDFRLKNNSSAIDSGSADLAPSTDILGNPRPQGAGYDIGAYEYLEVSSDTTGPSVPQNLSATAISETQISLLWQESSDTESGISHYNIYRNGSSIATSASASYLDTGLVSAATYSYEVSAINRVGLESDLSDAVEAATASDNDPPSVIAVSASQNSVEIQFSEELDESSARNVDNYSVDNDISIVSVSLDSEHIRVTLSTTDHLESVGYTITVANVEDIAGNPVPETEVSYEYEGGLIGLWRFNESSGSTAGDSSGNGNTGTLVNGPIWDTGELGSALKFDGTNDYVEIADSQSFDIESGLTIAAWINPAVAASYGTIMSKFAHIPGYRKDIYWFLYNNKVGASLAGPSGTVGKDWKPDVSIQTDTWTHLALTYDGTAMTMFKDGQNVASTNVSGDLMLANSSSNEPLCIGSNTEWGEYYNGIIDEVRIYNRALNEDEILNLFNEADSLVFEPIGDKEVNVDSTLTFEVITQDSDQEVFIQDDSSLPFEPNDVFADKVFTWTPTSNDIGSYEVTFLAPNDQYEDFETITITVNDPCLKPVYRFYSEQVKTHFYTIWEAEKDYIIAAYPEDVWRYEGIAWYAYPPDVQHPSATKPVYRFYSEQVKVHFYTISEAEKDYIIAVYPESIWRFEGVGWYAYAPGDQPAGATPVYRFYSEMVKRHFYTVSEQERDYIIATYPENIWRYEGIGWYAY